MSGVATSDDWVQNQLFAVLIALSLTVGMISGGTISLFGIGGGLFIYAIEMARQRRLVEVSPMALVFGWSFVALVWLAYLTATTPDAAWKINWRLVSIVLPLMLWFQVPARQFAIPDWVLRYLPWAMLAVMVLLIADFYTHGKVLLPILNRKPGRLVDYNRGVSYAAVLIWPLVCWLEQSGRLRTAATLIAALLVVAWISPSRGAVLAIVLGMLFWLLTRRSPRLAFKMACGLLAVAAFLSLAVVPWMFAEHLAWIRHLPPSWQHRVEIWEHLLAWHLPSPWLGLGTNASASVPFDAGHRALYKYATGSVQHPHHAFLQLWLDLGVLGWIWGVSFAYYVLTQIRELPVLQRAGGMAAWAAFITLTSGSFSLWADSFFATGALAMVAMSCYRGAAQVASPEAGDSKTDGGGQGVVSDRAGLAAAPNTNL